jgi:endonuclease/exonuclease/phosphatase family metal-dependent hydrolase
MKKSESVRTGPGAGDRLLQGLACVLVLLLASMMPAVAASLPRATGSELRVLVWNVSRESVFEQAEDYARVLAGLDADLMILDEVPADGDAGRLASALRLGPEWRVSYGRSGHNQRSALLARGEWRALADFEHIAYGRLARQRLLAATRPEFRAREAQSLAGGVAAHAAVLELGGRRLLVVGLDLQCCGDTPDSVEEQRRRIEARAIRQRVEGAVRRHPVDATLVGGDFNTTQGLVPVELVAGVGRDAPPRLRRVAARHADGQTWTWDGRGTPFASKALDHLLHSRELVARDALIFDPETLPPDRRLGLHPDLMRRLGDHRPIVVDFAWVP